MSSLIFVAVCGIALGANEPENYADAHAKTIETGRPMLVMVSTDWCMPCQMMKKTVIPQVRERGVLARVAFAIVNPDRDRELAHKITGGGPIPQLILYRKTSEGWTRKTLIGGQSVETVEQFINEGVANDATAKQQPAKEHAETTKKAASTSDAPPTA